MAPPGAAGPSCGRGRRLYPRVLDGIPASSRRQRIFSSRPQHLWCNIAGRGRAERWTDGGARSPAGIRGGRNVRRRTGQHRAHGQSVDAKSRSLHRSAGDLCHRGAHGCSLQPTNDLVCKCVIKIPVIDLYYLMLSEKEILCPHVIIEGKQAVQSLFNLIKTDQSVI